MILRNSLPLLLAMVSPLTAAPFAFNNGDVILGFRATGGDGSDSNIYFNLGPGTGIRDNGDQGVIGNINATLEAVYGAGWFSRDDLYFGAFGNLNFNPNTGIGSAGAVNGDPSRTAYVSARTDVAGAAIKRVAVSASLGQAGNRLQAIESTIMDTNAPILEARPDTSTVISGTTHPVKYQTSWTSNNPVAGNGAQQGAFIVFDGGIMNSFAQPLGESPVNKYIDIQRILSTNTGASPMSPSVGTGDYVATVEITNTGDIRLFKAGGSTPTPTAFENFIASFPELVNSPNATDRTADGDFDKDGVKNIVEFAFGGSPVSSSDNGQVQLRTVDTNSDSLKDFTRTIEVLSGATFTTSGNKLTATVNGITYTIEGSLDLVTFESPVSEVTPTLGTGSPKTGYVFKTFRLNAGNGLTGKGFIRAGASEN